MAHAATLAGLADNLVTAVTGRGITHQAFRKLKTNAVKGLRDQSHARTNQYAVKDKLDGMLEKLVVLNREDLSEALESRLSQLPISSGWMPEILSLLLELSDQPAIKTSLADVRTATQADTLTENLTWEDVLLNDPIEDPAIWETVERGYHSSGDDELDDVSEPTVSTKATSVEDINPVDVARLHLQIPDEKDLTTVKDAYRLWDVDTDDSTSLQLSELAVTRDMLSMLHGLPTDIFQKDVRTGKVTMARRVHFSTASRVSVFNVLRSAADTGTTLNALRSWAAEPQDTPYIQSVQAAVQRLLTKFGLRLGDIEQPLVRPLQDTIVSIIDVQAEINSAARNLVHIASLVQGCPSIELLPFGLLDTLYEAVAISQLAGDTEMYDSLLATFIAGFATYLRPVHSWVTAGFVEIHERKTFFVEELDKDCSPGESWHRSFHMRDAEYIPRCMQAVASRIFALGKTQSFLQSLEPEIYLVTPTEDVFGLPTIDEAIPQQSLMPFPQFLGDAIGSWLAGISTDRSESLPLSMLHNHGLGDTITALPNLYFSHNGSQFQSFADSLVEHMDPRLPKSWGDQFLLTELAHDTLGSLPGVEPANTYVSIIGGKNQAAPSSRIRKLGYVNLRYFLPWPVQNITRSSPLTVHAHVLSLLLQMHYSSRLLSQGLFELRSERRGRGEVLKLRQRIQCFISIFQSYIVLTANTVHDEMRREMELVSDIDAMVTLWAEYEKRLQHNLLLAPELDPLRQAVIRILVLTEVISMNLRPDRAKDLRGQFEKELRFLTAGLRNVSRARGHALEMLTERLEWTLR